MMKYSSDFVFQRLNCSQIVCTLVSQKSNSIERWWKCQRIPYRLSLEKALQTNYCYVIVELLKNLCVLFQKILFFKKRREKKKTTATAMIKYRGCEQTQTQNKNQQINGFNFYHFSLSRPFFLCCRFGCSRERLLLFSSHCYCCWAIKIKWSGLECKWMISLSFNENWRTQAIILYQLFLRLRFCRCCFFFVVDFVLLLASSKEMNDYTYSNWMKCVHVFLLPGFKPNEQKKPSTKTDWAWTLEYVL